jgi:serine/threonine protein kinase
VPRCSPEQYAEDAVLTTKIDVFSFGLILYELFVDRPVFYPSCPPFDVIRRLRARDLPAVPVTCGPFVQDLIRRCWLPDPNDRPSFDQIHAEFQFLRFKISDTMIAAELEDFSEALLEWERQSRQSI